MLFKAENTFKMYLCTGNGRKALPIRSHDALSHELVSCSQIIVAEVAWYPTSHPTDALFESVASMIRFPLAIDGKSPHALLITKKICNTIIWPYLFEHVNLTFT